MGDKLPAERSPAPVTVDSMVADLETLGVEPGETVLVHTSLSALGWVCGGAPTVVDALMTVLGPAGTIVMPTHTPGNRDPQNMTNPPVPAAWHGPIRDQLPPYRPAVTPTRGMGAVPECFRSYPEVRRSAHPQHSFAAWGSDAAFVTAGHTLDESLGESSPLARVYDRDGDVLLLGTDHTTNTSLHLAEYRADSDQRRTEHASAVLVDGEREWVQWEDLALDDSDFAACGAAFEAQHPEAVTTGTVGVGEAKLVAQRPLVDFATEWFAANR